MNLYRAEEHFAALPGLLLALFACAVLILQFTLPRKRTLWLFGLTLTGLAFAAAALWRQQIHVLAGGSVLAFSGALRIDAVSCFFSWLTVASAMLIKVASRRIWSDPERGDFPALVLFASAGMFFLAAARDLIVLFVALETMSLSFYALVGFERGKTRSNEAAIKYLLLGAFSSALFAYGLSILYGISGTTAMTRLDPGADPHLLRLALATLAAGILFKIGAAPFHFWAPDAYEGAPTSVTAFLSVASRAASFAVLLRILLGMLPDYQNLWEPIITAAAIASLILGNFGALTQHNVKRLLAYGSIAHTGYLLLGISAGSPDGLAGLLAYLAVYVAMTVAAFLVLIALERNGEPAETLEDLSGLARRHPGYAWLLTLALLSLAGLPPTAGFTGKLLIFRALVDQHQYGLALLGALYVAVALFYYFRVARAVLLRPEQPGLEAVDSPSLRTAAWITGVVTLAFGIYPQPLLEWVYQVVSP